MKRNVGFTSIQRSGHQAAITTARARALAVTRLRYPSMRTLVLTSRQNKPDEPELRRQIAGGIAPDIVSAEDGIGATVLDERSFATKAGLSGRILRHLPLIVAQTIEVWLRGNDYDAVVTWGERHSVVIAAAFRFRRRRPAHLAILMWPSKRNRMLMRLACRRIERFIVFSPLQRRFVEEQLGVTADRFVDARWPVDTNFWRPQEGSHDMICSVGMEMRDYATLLAAMRPLPIRCHIAAGQGLFNARFLAQDWQENVGDQGIPANVTLGRKSRFALRELYAQSRFVVVPLLPSDNDAGTTCILEAFAMGKAVICTESPGQTGLLDPGVNSVRVPPFDTDALRQAISELWSDPDKCKRLGEMGRQAVEAHHGFDHWGTQLARAVDEAIAVRRG